MARPDGGPGVARRAWRGADDRGRHHPPRRLVLHRADRHAGRGGHPDPPAARRSRATAIRTYEPALGHRRARPRGVGVLPGEAVEHRHRPRPGRRDGPHDRGRRLLGLRRHRGASSARCSRCCCRPTTSCAAASSRAPSTSRCCSSRSPGMLTMATANDLIVVFVALEVLSIPLYVLAAYDRQPAPVARGRHQVLRARRVLLGDLPLRRRARLRRHRDDLARRASRRSWRPTCSPTRGRCSPGWSCCSSGSASRSPRCRSTCGRRTSTRARRARSPASWPRPRRPPASPRCSACCSPALDAVPDRLAQPAIWALAVLTLLGRQHRRAAPDRPQAAARVLVDRHAGYVLIGVAGRDARRACRRRSSTCSSTRS